MFWFAEEPAAGLEGGGRRRRNQRELERRAAAAAEEEKGKRKAERREAGTEPDGRHRGAIPAPSSLRGAARLRTTPPPLFSPAWAAPGTCSRSLSAAAHARRAQVALPAFRPRSGPEPRWSAGPAVTAPRPSCSRRGPGPESRRTRRPARWPRWPLKGPRRPGFGAGRGSGGYHPVPFKMAARAARRLRRRCPCPGSRVGGPRPESGRVLGGGGRGARGPVGLPAGRAGAAAGGSGVPRGVEPGPPAGVNSGSSAHPGSPSRVMEWRRWPGEPGCPGPLVSALEGGEPRPESNPTQVGRRGPQTVEPFERALFASCKLATLFGRFSDLLSSERHNSHTWLLSLSEVEPKCPISCLSHN